MPDKILVGTSGYQYPEWRGKFYPEDLSTAKMLGFYTAHFRTTESNYSFRRIPSEKTVSNWRQNTPADFVFSLKAPQRITHFAKLRDCGDLTDAFCRVVAGLGEKLGVLLFQLPPSFGRDAGLLESFLRSLPAGPRVAFEFRHDSWFHDDVFELLKRHDAALCIAEAEGFATPKISTASFGYLRLRRGDYDQADLGQWAEWIQRQKWKKGFVYFKHEEAGVGPLFATSMVKLLLP